MLSYGCTDDNAFCNVNSLSENFFQAKLFYLGDFCQRHQRIHYYYSSTTIVFCQYLGLWIVFPMPLRKCESIRKRLVFFNWASTLSLVPAIEYAMIGAALVHMNSDYQWIIAILLPILRHVNADILIKLAS